MTPASVIAVNTLGEDLPDVLGGTQGAEGNLTVNGVSVALQAPTGSGLDTVQKNIDFEKTKQKPA
jgi:hypothetical protein